MLENCGTLVSQQFLGTMQGRTDTLTLFGSLSLDLGNRLDLARCSQKNVDLIGKHGIRRLVGGAYKGRVFDPKVFKYAGKSLSVLSIGVSVSQSACSFKDGNTGDGFEGLGRGAIAGLGMTGVGALPAALASGVLLIQDVYLDEKLNNQLKEIRKADCNLAKHMLGTLNGYISDISKRKCCCTSCEFD